MKCYHYLITFCKAYILEWEKNVAMLINNLDYSEFASSSSSNSMSPSEVSVTAAEVLRSNPSQGHPPVSSTTTTGWTPILQTASVRPTSRINNSTGTVRVNSNEQSIPQQHAEVFPCLHPINPHMRDSENRLQTFVDRAASWLLFG